MDPASEAALDGQTIWAHRALLRCLLVLTGVQPANAGNLRGHGQGRRLPPDAPGAPHMHSEVLTTACASMNLGSGYRLQGQACSPVGFQSDSRILQDLNDRQLFKFSAMSGAQPS